MKRRSQLSTHERVVLAALALWSLCSIGALLVRAVTGDGVWTGIDARQPADGYQYLAWIREAGEHGLIGNRFDLVTGSAVYLQPLFFVSGLLWKLGLSLQLALLVWKPVSLIVLFAGFAAYVRRMVPADGWARAASLVVALFFVTPLAPLLNLTGLGSSLDRFQAGHIMARELLPALSLWGYPPQAIALGLMPLFLLGIERILTSTRDGDPWPKRRRVIGVAAIGVLVSWLHPWQGLTLLLILGGLVAWGRFGRRYVALAAPALATLTPLVHYLVLSRTDGAWELARKQNAFCAKGHSLDLDCVLHISPWVLVAGLAPLGATALLAALRPAEDDQERMIRLWPVAGVAAYLWLSPSFPYHALAGLSLPLAVLAVRGWQDLRLPTAVGVAAVFAVTFPAIYFIGNIYSQSSPTRLLPYVITGSEQRALEFLESSPRRGPVIARGLYLGVTVPALTGRNSWVGHPSWTPRFHRRLRDSEALLDGRLAPDRARQIVGRAGRAFVLADCRTRANLRASLGDLVERSHRFGCAAVYETSPPTRGAKPSRVALR